MASEQPKYTDSQVYRYIERINFPIPQPPSFPAATLETLRRLVAGHLHAIPFENLSLHYSTHRTISLDPQFLFDKFVNRRHGGYCMEQNLAFSTLLRSLGFQSYNIGARVILADQLCGFNHMAIIVTLDDIEYLVDVGFGGNGLTAPLPIFNGNIIEEPINGVIPEQHRVQLDELPISAKKRHKTWMLQHRRNTQAKWETRYAFEKDFEFYSGDYEAMNMSTSQHPQSLFLNLLVCINVDYHGLDAISRNILVNTELKKRENGETKRMIVFETEEERVAVLKDMFQIALTVDEREAIKGQKLAVDKFDPQKHFNPF